jgi:beta-phosphoglucomutase-like phosphatase (HAD superfamily)
MDGVLVDTEPLSERGFRRYVEALGRPELMAWFPRMLGRRLQDFVGGLAEDIGRPPEQVAHDLRENFYAIVDDEGLTGMAGVPDAVFSIADGRPVALATSSRRAFAERVLDTLSLADVFAATATGDEVVHGKPHPEIYLLAAARLGVEPATCIAIEDTPTGVASAKAAGMEVIAVPNPQTRGLDLSAADAVVADLHAAAAVVAAR